MFANNYYRSYYANYYILGISVLRFVKAYNNVLPQASSHDTFGDFVQFFVFISISFTKVTKRNLLCCCYGLFFSYISYDPLEYFQPSDIV